MLRGSRSRGAMSLACREIVPCDPSEFKKGSSQVASSTMSRRKLSLTDEVFAAAIANDAFQ